MADRPVWYKQPGEGAAQYAAFCLYRDAGPDRGIARVAAAAVASKSPRSHHQRRYLTHPRPEVYLRSIVRCWKRWSSRFSWPRRAQAYDDHLAEAAQERAFETALAAQQAEIEENERQRQLRREETRAARTVGRQILLRVLRAIESRELEGLPLSQILPHLQKVSALIELGQRLEEDEQLDRRLAELEAAVRAAVGA
jgi:hypothetical protein